MQRQLTHFRRLACLGLPPQSAVVALLESLHELVPSSFNRFGFADARLRITNGYCENPDLYPFFAPYFADFDGRMSYWPSVQACLQRGPGVGYYLPYQTPDFYHSRYYNEIERRVGAYHQLDATIGDGRRVFGNVVLARPQGHPFQADECALLARLIPYLAHALAAQPEVDHAPGADAREVAVVMVDQHGALQCADALGLRYLWMLAHDDLVTTDIVSKAMVHHQAIATLVGQLLAIEGNQASVPPSLRIRNGWGSFELRAARMYGAAGATAQFRIVIERVEVSALVLCRRLHRLQLSPRQREVCECLLKGLTQAEIAQRLGLRPSTVNEYVQALYARLGIHSRQALISSLSVERFDDGTAR